MSFFRFTHVDKKMLARGLICILVIPLLYVVAPQKTYAVYCPPFFCLDPVQDVEGAGTLITTGIDASTNVVHTAFSAAQYVKSFVLDGLANAIARQMIRSLTQQTVSWINSGFKGNPAYVTNPNQFFQNIGDNVAAQFLSKNATLNSLCSPFKNQIRLALVKNYLGQDTNRYTCTLGKLEQNFNAFTNDFSTGGWEGWFAMTQTSQNNPYGAYLAEQMNLSAQIAGKQIVKTQDLNRGTGFLGYQKCDQWVSPPATSASSVADAQFNLDLALARLQAIVDDPNHTQQQLDDANDAVTLARDALDQAQSTAATGGTGIDNAANNPDQEDVGDKNSSGMTCKKVSTVTPGSVISNQLSSFVKSPQTQLELTNSINQIISALMVQMVQQVVGGIGNGLRGLSQSGSGSSSGGNSSAQTLLQQMAAGSSAAKAEDTATGATINQTKTDTMPTPAGTQLTLPSKTDLHNQNLQDANGYVPAYGEGGVDCSNFPDSAACSTSHSICQGGACVSVSGAGTNECSTYAECQ